MAFQGVMLAKKYNRKKITLPCYTQPKFDGVRAIWDFEDECFYTRNGNIIEGVPSLTANLARINSYLIKHFGKFNLDGELTLSPTALSSSCAVNVNFNKVNGIVRRKKANIAFDENQINYQIFDFQSKDAFKTRTEFLQGASRRTVNGNKLQRQMHVHFTPGRYITHTDELDSVHTMYSQYYEGSIYRLPESKYEYKRSDGLLKRKDFFSLEAKPVSFQRGEGKYSNTLGAIEVRVVKTSTLFTKCLGKRFFVGSGFTDAERDYIWYDTKMYKGKTLLVKFQQLSEYNIPRFPIFKGFTNL